MRRTDWCTALFSGSLALMSSAMVSTSLAAGKLNRKCGKKAKWSYDTKTDALTISGKGVVSRESDLWFDLQTGHGRIENTTKNSVIKKGITAVGDGCFSFMLALKSVKIASSVKTIGEGAFNNFHSLKR